MSRNGKRKLQKEKILNENWKWTKCEMKLFCVDGYDICIKLEKREMNSFVSMHITTMY